MLGRKVASAGFAAALAVSMTVPSAALAELAPQSSGQDGSAVARTLADAAQTSGQDGVQSSAQAQRKLKMTGIARVAAGEEPYDFGVRDTWATLSSESSVVLLGEKTPTLEQFFVYADSEDPERPDDPEMLLVDLTQCDVWLQIQDAEGEGFSDYTEESEYLPAGVYRYAIKAKEDSVDYTGTGYSSEFTVVDMTDIAAAEIAVGTEIDEVNVVSYNGGEGIQVPYSVRMYDELLFAGIDFDVSYSVFNVETSKYDALEDDALPTEIGFYQATFTGKDGYHGSNDIEFEVVDPKLFAYADFDVTEPEYVVGDESGRDVFAHTLTTLDGKRLTMGEDYELYYTEAMDTADDGDAEGDGEGTGDEGEGTDDPDTGEGDEGAEDSDADDEFDLAAAKLLENGRFTADDADKSFKVCAVGIGTYASEDEEEPNIIVADEDVEVNVAGDFSKAEIDVYNYDLLLDEQGKENDESNMYTWLVREGGIVPQLGVTLFGEPLQLGVDYNLRIENADADEVETLGEPGIYTVMVTSAQDAEDEGAIIMECLQVVSALDAATEGIGIGGAVGSGEKWNTVVPEVAYKESGADEPSIVFTEGTDYEVSYSYLGTAEEPLGSPEAVTDFEKAGDYQAIFTVKDGGRLTGSFGDGGAVIFTLSEDAGPAATLDACEFTIMENEFLETGAAIYPELIGLEDFTEGIDYEVVYEDADGNEVEPVEPGTYMVWARGIGTHEGESTLSAEFDIISATSDITLAEVSLAKDSYYVGDDPFEGLEVSVGGIPLKKDKDYVAIIAKYVDDVPQQVTGLDEPGTYGLVLRGKDAFTGKAYSEEFQVTVANALTAEDVEVAELLTYDEGKALQAQVSVTHAGETLEAGTDYTVAYCTANGMPVVAPAEIGSYVVVVTGKGAYTGTVESALEVVASNDLQHADVVLGGTLDGSSEPVYSYVGTPVEPELTVNMPGVEEPLKAGTDFDVSYYDEGGTELASAPVEPGTWTVRITGKGSATEGYVGQRDIEFQITARTLSADNATLEVRGTYAYDGTAQTPALRVSYGEEKIVLEEGKDYRISYVRDNINAGKASVGISGIGGYDGTLAAEFEIAAVSIADAVVELDGATDLVYDGTAQEPKVAKVMLGEGEEAIELKDDDYTVTYKDNVNAGKAAVEIAGAGNYTGTVSEEFDIAQLVLSGEDVAIELSQTEYSMRDAVEDAKPDVTVRAGGMVVPAADYTVEYTIPQDEDNDVLNAGTATVKIAAVEDGNCTGEKTAEYTISDKASIKNAVVVFDEEAEYTYDGTAHEAQPMSVTVEVEGNTVPLTSPADYTLEWADNVNAGTATVKIIGAGDYAGMKTATFEIKPASLKDAVVELADADAFFYDGTGKEPKVAKVTLGEGEDAVELDEDDYTVSYDNNIDAGEKALAIVTGKGNYTGTANAEFSIGKRDISKAKMTFDPAVSTYNGAEQEPKVVLTMKIDGKDVVIPSTDYTVTYKDHKDAGVATATIKAVVDGNCTGELSKAFQIKPLSLEGAIVTLSLPEGGYYADGTAKEPDVAKVEVDGVELPAEDYAVSYSSNTEAGTATATVSALRNGNLTGSASATFEIKAPTDISEAVVTLTDGKTTYAHTGEAIEPAVESVVLGEGEDAVTLEPDTDYTVAYENNTELGTATVKVTGAGKYAGTASATFQIVELKDIAKAAITLSQTNYTYDGTAKQPEVKSVVLGEGEDATTLDAADYTVAYDSNTNAGTATVKVDAKEGSLYTGTATATFTIGRLDISKATVTLQTTTYTYDGKAKEPAVKEVKVGNVTVPASGYDKRYENNKNEGTATVSLAGKGNFTGTVTATFKINKASSSTGGGSSSTANSGISGTYTDPATGMAFKAVAGGVEVTSVKAAASVVIPDTKRINGKNYAIVAVSAAALAPAAGTATSVTLGKYITSIPANAFKNFTKLKKATIGASVVSIGVSAFQNCKALKSIVIPASVKSIGKLAFAGCKKLKTATVKTKSLKSAAKIFKGDKKLTIKLPKAKKKAYKKIFKAKKLGCKKVKLKWTK